MRLSTYCQSVYAGLALLLGLTASVLLPHTARGQAEPIEFGKVPADEFDPTRFAQDTGAAAVVLADFGRTYIVPQDGFYKVRFDRIRRVKILREAGFNEATARIPLYHHNQQREELVELKGATYNLEGGKVVATEVSGKTAPQVRISDRVDERRLTLPNVKVGSVVEFAYSQTSDFFFTLPDWWFQEDIPVRWTEYRVQVPEFLEYVAQVQQAYRRFDVEQAEQGTSLAFNSGAAPVRTSNYRWVCQNVPAFHEEDFMTTPKDYMGHVTFQLRATRFPGMSYQNVARSWKAMSGELLAHDRFGGVLGSVGALNKPLLALRSKADTLARAAAVVALVRQSLAWNGRDGAMTTGAMRAALERKQGNAAEVNLLLISALRMAGLAADPVILSTRENGAVVGEEPVVERFNYVLALLRRPGRGDQLLDATQPHAAFGMLPENCLGTRGRIIADREADRGWLTVQSAAKYTSFTSGTLTFEPTGAVKGSLHCEFSGYSGQRVRQQAAQLEPTKLVARHAAVGPEVRVTKHQLTSPPELEQAVTLDVEVAADGEEKPAPLLFFSMKDFGGTSTNPFRSPDRLFPVDLGAPIMQTVMLELQVPEGYQVETVPTPLLVRTPDAAAQAQFVYTPAPDGRSVQVTSRLMLNRTLYRPEEYTALRNVYQKLVSKHAEQLVLKRKS